MYSTFIKNNIHLEKNKIHVSGNYQNIKSCIKTRSKTLFMNKNRCDKNFTNSNSYKIPNNNESIKKLNEKIIKKKDSNTLSSPILNEKLLTSNEMTKNDYLPLSTLKKNTHVDNLLPKSKYKLRKTTIEKKRYLLKEKKIKI